MRLLVAAGATVDAALGVTELPYTADFETPGALGYGWLDLRGPLPDLFPSVIEADGSGYAACGPEADPRAVAYRVFDTADDFSVTVSWEVSLNNQAGPLAMLGSDGSGVLALTAYANVLFSGMYLVEMHNEYLDRVVLDSLPVAFVPGAYEITIRVHDGEVSLLWNGEHVCGPVAVPAEIVGSAVHGMYMGQIIGSPGRQSLFEDFAVEAFAGPHETLTPPVVAGNGTPTEVSSATSIAVPYPASVAEGDLLVAFVAYNNGSQTVPTGWTQVSTTAGAPRLTVMRKVADAADAAASAGAGTVTFSKSGGTSGVAAGIMLRVTGQNPTLAIPQSMIRSNTSTTSHTLTAIDVAGIQRLGLLCVAVPANNAVTLPAGWTLVAETGTGGSAINLVVADRDTAYTIGDTGTLTATTGAASTSATWHSALPPAPTEL